MIEGSRFQHLKPALMRGLITVFALPPFCLTSRFLPFRYRVALPYAISALYRYLSYAFASYRPRASSAMAATPRDDEDVAARRLSLRREGRMF